MTTDACHGAKAAITGGDGVSPTPIVERMAPVGCGRIRALPFAHLARDPWQARRFCAGRTGRLVRGDDERLDLSATHRLYSTRMRPRVRGCHMADSWTDSDSHWKTAMLVADPNKEASHANRSRLQNECETGKRRRESRVRRPGLLLLFTGMSSAFHGEPAILCACPGGRSALARLMDAMSSVRGAA